MKSIPLSLRVSRLLAAMTLLAGISGPAFAKPEKALLSSNKEGASVQRSGTDQTGKSLKVAGCFEANNGQTNASVKFYTRTPGYTLYLTAAEAVMVMPKAAAASGQNGVVRMKLKGANASPAVQGLDIQPGYSNYLIGSDPSKWQTGVKQYFKVKFAQVYPGIDMIYRLNNGQVENDFIVAPGANPQRILIGFEGNKGLRLDRRGNLVLLVAGGELTYKAPTLYQTLGSKRVPVKGRYVLASNKNVRFEVGNYIKEQRTGDRPSAGLFQLPGRRRSDE